MISWVLEIGGNSKAKLMTKVYYLYTILLSIFIGILIIFWGDFYIDIFTKLESIQKSLQICMKIYLINCVPELLYLSTTTILKLNKQQNFAFKIFTLIFPIYTGISAFLFCFGFHMGVKGLILSFSTGKAIAILLSLKKLFQEWWNLDSEDPQKISLISKE